MERSIEKVNARPQVSPRVDIYENNDELLLLCDLPGVKESGLKISLEKDQLTLEAQGDDDVSGASVLREFRSTDYHRSFVLPGGIDTQRASADLRNGVLWLRLPKSEAIKPRRIEVKPADS